LAHKSPALVLVVQEFSDIEERETQAQDT
jgi:hypothetical protein